MMRQSEISPRLLELIRELGCEWAHSALAGENEAEALARWEEVKAVARESLVCGEQAALAVEDGYNGPRERATFGATLRALEEEWKPTGASE